MDLRLVDLGTGQIVAAASVEGSANKLEGGVALESGKLIRGLSAYSKTPMATAIRKMIKKAVSFVVAQTNSTILTEREAPSAGESRGTTSGSTTEAHAYTYKAYTYANVSKSGDIQAGGLSWRCSGKACSTTTRITTGVVPTVTVAACGDLARQVGRMRHYSVTYKPAYRGHPGMQLNSAGLGQCNARISTASGSTGYTYTALMYGNVRKAGRVLVGNQT